MRLRIHLSNSGVNSSALMAGKVQGYSTSNTYAIMQESQENQSTDLSTFNCLREPDSIKSGKNELKCKAG